MVIYQYHIIHKTACTLIYEKYANSLTELFSMTIFLLDLTCFGGQISQSLQQCFPTTPSERPIAQIHPEMECYATPWPLWRESWILWHIVEPSFAFVIILAHCLGGGVIFLQHFISQT